MQQVFVHFIDTKENKVIKFNSIPNIGEKFSQSANGDVYIVKDVLHNNFSCQYKTELYAEKSSLPF